MGYTRVDSDSRNHQVLTVKDKCTKSHLMVWQEGGVNKMCTLGSVPYNKDLLSSGKRLYQSLNSPRQKVEGPSPNSRLLWPCLSSKEVGGEAKKHR